MVSDQHFRPIHPFPARMAPELVWEELPESSPPLSVLDPMSGSGTTLVAAKLRGHKAMGCDRDPLAVLIARAWLSEVRPDDLRSKAVAVLERARSRAKAITLGDAYPYGADDETREFVRYWFDRTNRIQLTALANSIARVHDQTTRDLLWCAFSRLIITKQRGVSLAMDVSHSRPHRTYDRAPINALDYFQQSVNRVATLLPFKPEGRFQPATVANADARSLPIPDASIDIVITSPPYLNAIDYIRGHKFTLIWMGHRISALRRIRASNVGTETTSPAEDGFDETARIVDAMCSGADMSSRNRGMLRQYIRDMRAVLCETRRVLRKGGKAVFVVGNCNLRGTFVRNSTCIELLAGDLDLEVVSTRKRPLPENRRYLPPPESARAGIALKNRMREEVILTLKKE